MTELDEPRLCLLIDTDMSILPHMYEAKRFDHRDRLLAAGAKAPWVTINLGDGKAITYGALADEPNQRCLVYQAALGLPVVNVTGPAIISGLSPDSIVSALAGTRGTLAATQPQEEEVDETAARR
jgi:hypothetical protein